MLNNQILSGDPYEGAYTAFRALNPDATGEDWENFLRDDYFNPQGQFDNFGAFAALSRDAEMGQTLSEADRRVVAYAAGFFEAMNLAISGLRDTMPTSPHVSGHFERYRSNLKRFPERYLEIEAGDDMPF